MLGGATWYCPQNAERAVYGASRSARSRRADESDRFQHLTVKPPEGRAPYGNVQVWCADRGRVKVRLAFGNLQSSVIRMWERTRR